MRYRCFSPHPSLSLSQVLPLPTTTTGRAAPGEGCPTSVRAPHRHCRAQGNRLGTANDYTHPLVEASRHVAIHPSPHTPAMNPSSHDWERWCSADLKEKRSLKRVFAVYTWQDGLYSRSRTQRNTMVGKDLTPSTDLVTSRSLRKRQPQHVPSRRSCSKAHLGRIKTTGPHRSLRMEVSTPKRSSAIQTPRSDNAGPTAEGGDGHLLSSLPHIPEELCVPLAFTSARVSGGKLLSFSISLLQ